MSFLTKNTTNQHPCVKWSEARWGLTPPGLGVQWFVTSALTFMPNLLAWVCSSTYGGYAAEYLICTSTNSHESHESTISRDSASVWGKRKREKDWRISDVTFKNWESPWSCKRTCSSSPPFFLCAAVFLILAIPALLKTCSIWKKEEKPLYL